MNHIPFGILSLWGIRRGSSDNDASVLGFFLIALLAKSEWFMIRGTKNFLKSSSSSVSLPLRGLLPSQFQLLLSLAALPNLTERIVEWCIPVSISGVSEA